MKRKLLIETKTWEYDNGIIVHMETVTLTGNTTKQFEGIKRRSVPLEKVHAELMKNPKFRAEFNRFNFWFELSELWTDIKIRVISFLKGIK